MPSIRNLVLSLGLTALVQLATASPVPNPVAAVDAALCTTTPVSKPVGATPTLPLTGDATELPSTNLTLVAVAVGRGTQNYTCSAIGAVPLAVGAYATLYDATTLAYSNLNLLNTIPGLIVGLPVPTGALATAASRFPVLGHHFFDSAGTPTFELTAIDKVGFVAKTAAAAAPSTANKGPAGTGAVPWLYLVAKAGYTSVGVTQVYRVETAGGNAQTSCTAVGSEFIEYAAEYWFYN